MALVAIADLENRWGAVKVRQFLDDDGDGVADATPTAQVIADTEATVRGVLYQKGYSAELITAIENDAQLRRLAAEVAMGFAGERRPEWLNAEGNGPFEAFRKRALERLRLIAVGELRVAAEATVGQQRTGLTAEVDTRDPTFLVAESATNRVGPGGF